MGASSGGICILQYGRSLPLFFASGISAFLVHAPPRASASPGPACASGQRLGPLILHLDSWLNRVTLHVSPFVARNAIRPTGQIRCIIWRPASPLGKEGRSMALAPSVFWGPVLPHLPIWMNSATCDSSKFFLIARRNSFGWANIR